MWPYYLAALCILCQCTLLVSILSFTIHWLLLTLLDQLIGNNIKSFLQLIECSWCFSCKSDHFHWDLVPSGVFCCKQALSINVGHILIVLVWDSVFIWSLLSCNLASMCPHNLRCNSNILSIRGKYDPPNMSILHSNFWDSLEDYLNRLYCNILHRNHPHIGRENMFWWTHNPFLNGTG